MKGKWREGGGGREREKQRMNQGKEPGMIIKKEALKNTLNAFHVHS